MTFDEYQERAATTALLNTDTNDGRMELVFGLVSEVGALARAFKLYLRDDVGLEAQRERLVEDLGDIQWYLATLARSLGIRLGDIIEHNLARTTDRYSPSPATSSGWHPPFDDGLPERESFPRRMLFQIVPSDDSEGRGAPHAIFRIMDAQPYVFDLLDGEVDRTVGFAKGQAIGDAVNDNALTEDGYRFHDAVHVAFMAVLGWSPVMRHLLRVKRKSDPAVDRSEDGARARDLEEALSAILKAFSASRNDFGTEGDVDGEVRDLIRLIVGGLEVGRAPIWLWARAISQGYAAMNLLRLHGGGWLTADLDAQTVTFSTEAPAFA